ncbi:hypothetical protein BUALT_Bualt15G0014600 [Buddleja alternifolia]|uniref:Uncharacterized protein n=1 Tax=Buddleja alternifolia TaxID=168488 RepID=A0AAV6WMD4_9LAMI|nr:hypothetical protein BUALT_Bualt15G0014600 [Buddleja alternifolia]
MATTQTPSATDQSSNTTKTVDASLWWEPFHALLTELENASFSSDLPKSLEKKLKDNHAWFVDTVSRFKLPNQKSREALDSGVVKIGPHELNVQPEFKETALKISSILCLDEVQSYIIVKRSVDRNNAAVVDMHSKILNMVLLEYYTERQCLLKCTRQILMHALYFGSQSGGSAVLDEAQRLISDGLESKLLSIFQDLLSSNYPEQMDIDLYALWAEETLIEDNLILDILFLAYYESFCVCDAKCWKRLCALYEDIITGSYNFQKLAISPEAIYAIYHAKVQLLLILIEALNLEILLQMVHDNIPFRQGSIAFSEMDIQEMDTMISSFSAFETKEAGPLILAWAVFLCLISSLPEKEENNLLMEIDHTGYVRQAFEASSLGYFLEILQSDTLKDSDGPLAGYRSVLRTFVSAFIASYEISLQFDDDNLRLILDILCKIYRGEESLCIQFWDKDSFIDGPIRCLLCNLEGEFPFRMIELVSLLSALCEGAWPSECVFNFLDKSVGLSTPVEISSEPVVDAVSKIVESRFPLRVAGVEGLVIPSKSQGQVLRMIDKNRALVRWEYTESGLLVLLLRLAQDLYMKNSEELIVILDLLSRLVTFNKAVCYSLMDAGNSFRDEATLMGDQEKYMRIDVVEIVCALVKSLSPSVHGAVMMSMGVNILTKMLKCLPSHVAAKAMKGNIFDVALRTNPFDVGSNSLSSGSWLLSGRLAKILLVDLLDFTMKLLDTGLENDTVLALIVFSLQYVLVNHEFWKYKMKHARWKVTVKVLEVMKKCISSISCCQKLGNIVRDILLCDSSLHSALFRIVCTTTHSLENLYVSRLFEIPDIEGLQLSISTGLDVLVSMVSTFSKDSVNFPVFHQAILSPMTKPVPVITAAISLISYFRDPKIQIGATRLLSVLFIADFSQSNASLGLNDEQMTNFRKSICSILSEQLPWNEDLVVATLMLLTSAARNQPAFFTAVISSNEYLNSQAHNADSKHQPNKTENGSLDSKEGLLYVILQHVKRCEDLLHSQPNTVLSLLNFLRTLWQGAPQFTKILERLKVSDKFWRQLTNSVMLITKNKGNLSEKMTEKELQSLSCRYQYLSNVFDILGYEIFLQKKLLHAELVVNRISKSPTNGTDKSEGSKFTKDESLSSLKEIMSTWCNSSLLSDLIKACVSWEYDNSAHMRVKVAASLFAVHAMVKLRRGDLGSLSLTLIERIITLSQNLCKLPAFSELLSQYTERGYSGGHELENLILSDLFYHIQGELEGRQIDNRPFKELLQFLLDSNFMDTYKYKQDDNLLENIKCIYLYDTVHLRADLGLEMWDLLAWKESKEVAETVLLCSQDANSVILLSNSKLSALRGLITLLYMHENNLTENEASIGLEISEQIVSSCIDHLCQCLHTTLESLTPIPDASEDVLDILTAQAELLLLLVRSSSNKFSQPSCGLILKTSGYGLKILCSFKPSVTVGAAKKFLLVLILSSVESGVESLEGSAEASNASLGLLPLLCNCIEHPDHCTMSLAAIDLILKGFSMPATWFPIIEKHLQLQHVVQKLQDSTLSKTVSVILKFLLNLACVRQGAEMLLNAGILESLRMLLSDFSESGPFSNISDKIEKSQSIWGLSLAVLTAIIQSLGDSSSSASIVDYVMACIMVEKAPLISYYLSAPDFPADGHEKKRARALKSNISLSELNETQNTLALICVLARHGNSWKKVLQNVESQLREKSIHLLAFISRATQRPGESPKREAPLLCYPALKEEFEWYKKPSFINSKNGWFALSGLGCKLNPKFASLSSITTALVLRGDPSNENANLSPQTHLSDIIAIEIYKIAFLLLKFLCIQAESAARKADEVGFVDLAHFPELPMPDILHGLQDQGIAIITELCEANKMKQIAPEIQEVCLSLLQITVMSLYLEFCVIQICGIRPVLGHVETFSKELRLLIRGNVLIPNSTEGHVFLKEPLKALKQIVSFVYPELIQAEALF